MAKENYDEKDGVWRTVGGRRIFIKNGQSLADAMKESGKFNTAKKDDKKKESKKVKEEKKEKYDYAKETDPEKRLKNVYMMDRVLRGMNNEEALSEGWLMNGVADGDTDKGWEAFKEDNCWDGKDDYGFYVEDEAYNDMCKMYKNLVNEYAKDGVMTRDWFEEQSGNWKENAGLTDEELAFLQQDVPDVKVYEGEYKDRVIKSKEEDNKNIDDDGGVLKDTAIKAFADGDIDYNTLVKDYFDGSIAKADEAIHNADLQNAKAKKESISNQYEVYETEDGYKGKGKELLKFIEAEEEDSGVEAGENIKDRLRQNPDETFIYDNDGNVLSTERQVEAGNKLIENSKVGARNDIKAFLSGKENYDGNRDDFIKDIANEWGLDKEEVEDILHEENEKHPRAFKNEPSKEQQKQMTESFKSAKDKAFKDMKDAENAWLESYNNADWNNENWRVQDKELSQRRDETREAYNKAMKNYLDNANEEDLSWLDKVARNDFKQEEELAKYNDGRHEDDYYEVFRKYERENAKLKNEGAKPEDEYVPLNSWGSFHKKMEELTKDNENAKWSGKEYTNDEFMEHLEDANWHTERRMLETAGLTNQEMEYVKDHTTLGAWTADLDRDKTQKLINEAKDKYRFNKNNSQEYSKQQAEAMGVTNADLELSKKLRGEKWGNGESVLRDKKGNARLDPKYNRESNDRKVNLGIDVTSDTANKDLDILDSVTGQLSDGIWENTPSQYRYWRNMDYEQHDNKINFATNTRNYQNPFNNKDDKQVKEYLANKIKQIAKIEMEDDHSKGSWDRNNNNKLEYLSYNEDVTVADAYNLYDRLKGRTEKKAKTTNEIMNDAIRNKATKKTKDLSSSKTTSQRYSGTLAYLKEMGLTQHTIDEILKRMEEDNKK